MSTSLPPLSFNPNFSIMPGMDAGSIANVGGGSSMGGFSPWGLAGSALSSVLGQNTTTNTDSSLNGTSSYTPNLDPNTTAFLQRLTAAYGGMMSPVNMGGYIGTQTNQLMGDNAARRAALATALASRGLSTSPISLTANQNLNNQTFQQLAQFRESLPLLSNQLFQQNLAGATGLFSQIPKGYTTSEQQQGTSHSTTKGGLLGLL